MFTLQQIDVGTEFRQLETVQGQRHDSSYSTGISGLGPRALNVNASGVGVGLYYKRIVHVFLCALVCTIGALIALSKLATRKA